MIRHCKGGRSPACHSVATLAAATVGALEKLAAMWIGLVAINTSVMGDRRLEVPALVAGQAGHVNMLAQQRKVRPGVVEGRGEGGPLPRIRIPA